MPAAIAVAGLALQAKSMADQKKAASQAAQAAQTGSAGAGVNIADVSRQAEEQATRNIVRGREMEDIYSPGASQYRDSSLQALLQGMNEPGADLSQYINAAGANTYSGPAAGAPLQAHEANSGLLADAVAKARSDLALGGNLPQDVRNLVAHQAAATSGTVSGGLGLGRDIGLRDLGLTSLDIAQRRLTNAGTLGQAELGANQFNAGQRTGADVANLGARQFDAGQQQQAAQFGAGQQLNIAQLLEAIQSGRFSQQLAGAQFGQSLTPPTVGLDPSAIANLAVGNSNIAANGAQNAAAIRAQGANGLGQLGGQLTGLGMAAYQNRTPAPQFQSFQQPVYPANSFSGLNAAGRINT